MTAPVPDRSFYKPVTKRTFNNIQFIEKYNNKELYLSVLIIFLFMLGIWADQMGFCVI